MLSRPLSSFVELGFTAPTLGTRKDLENWEQCGLCGECLGGLRGGSGGSEGAPSTAEEIVITTLPILQERKLKPRKVKPSTQGAQLVPSRQEEKGAHTGVAHTGVTHTG